MFKKLFVAAALAVAAPAVFAADAVDYTQLTTGVDFSGAITAVMAAGVSIIGVLVATKGVRMVMAMFGR